MANGKINKELKQEIDDIQLYIDYLWEQGRDKDVLVYIKLKDSLCERIKPISSKNGQIAASGEMDSEFVTNRQWDSYATRIMNKNLKLNGHSLTRSGICRRANDFILDIRSDQGGMIVKIGWREAMRKES